MYITRNRGKVAGVLLSAMMVATAGCHGPDRSSGEFDYLIGRGIADITGPAAGIQMFGYAKQDQVTAGIHFRLRSRAFVIAQRDSKRRVALVCMDLGSAPHEIQREVVDRLRPRYGDAYGLANVVLSATHTHSGPGGYWHYGVDGPLGGKFYKAHFEAIVEGIVASITQAHEDLEPANIFINRGQVDGAGAQRSATAYQNNPAEERARYDSDTDKDMTLLKFTDASGPIGLMNWFAVHPTSMTYNNRLISGDHKGHASYLFERTNNGDAGSGNFVAIFANSNCGDVTSNLNLDNTGPGEDEFDSTRIIAERQFAKAKELFDSATERIEGEIDYVQTYVDFSCLEVSDAFTGAGVQHTCPSAYGYAFAAGSTEDGGGHPLFKEGMKKRVPLIDMQLKQLVPTPDDKYRPCHLPKVLLFAPGTMDPPGQAQILPISIIRIGQLCLIAVPGEMTTMAGRRLRETVATRLGTTAKYVVIAGYANDYAGYITTKEEYDTQQYEGGHTLYGPWTLAGYQQEFARLATALAAGDAVTADVSPRDLRGQVTSTPLGTPYDATPAGVAFGDVVEDACSSYARGEQVKVRFWTGHPNNNFEPGGNTLAVQRRVGDKWTTVAVDHDWSTKFHWKSIDAEARTSQAMITWDIPEDVEVGAYRILHFGAYKHQGDGKVVKFTGRSRGFDVK